MSRSRSDSLVLTLGVLLLALVILFFLTHRPLPVEGAARPGTLAPADPAANTAAESAESAADDDPSRLDLAATTAELAQKLSTRLTRADTRAHEAVLIFKTAEGYARFLARAAEAGVIVAGQIEPLHIVRVRVRAYDAFAADLVARAADYGGVSANTFVQMPPAPEERFSGRQFAVGNALLAAL
ncbi:MAG TPA: hypothetical protein VIM46_06980, partial [Luteolibacter sp.]